MIVLTRKSMWSPTNAILTGLAFTDLLVMVEYIPYVMHANILTGRSDVLKYSWGWAVFVLFHAYFTQVFHTISIWLTVLLAVWRYIAIARPQNNEIWCSLDRTQYAVILIFICSIIFNIPNYIALTITTHHRGNYTLYVVNFSELALKDDGLLKDLNFCIYSVVMKLLPCAALTWLSIALIQKLLEAAKRRAALMQRNSSGRAAGAESQADRVTKMLLAILILFLISEVPQGIAGLLVIIPGYGFLNCYMNLGDIMDMLVLFNSAVNFILYCSMSQQFRTAFNQLFEPCCTSMAKVSKSRPWKKVPQSESATESNNTCITNV